MIAHLIMLAVAIGAGILVGVLVGLAILAVRSQS
jgi:hypothetical protein